MKVKIFLFCIYFFNIGILKAQLLPLSYFQNNQLQLLNPGAWNMDILKYDFLPRHHIGISYRTQYVGIDGAPMNLGMVYDFMPNNSMLAGVHLLSDQFGPYSSIGGGMKYAYRVFVSSSGFISGGFQGQFTQLSYDPFKLTDFDVTDPFANWEFSGTALHLSAGIFYSDQIFDPSWQFCIGASYLNMSSIDIGGDHYLSNLPVFVGHLHLFKFLSETENRKSFVETSIVMRSASKLGTAADLRLRYQHKGIGGIQAGLRSSYYDEFALSAIHLDFNFMLGALTGLGNKGLDLNYSFEYPIGILGDNTYLSHEIGLGFLF